jgi:putative transposase
MGSDHCNYLIMVTSNHVNLLVVDDGDRNVIPRSMQLVAGRPGQEYNNPRPIES